jgi:hypothetical protein
MSDVSERSPQRPVTLLNVVKERPGRTFGRGVDGDGAAVRAGRQARDRRDSRFPAVKSWRTWEDRSARKAPGQWRRERNMGCSSGD